MSVLGAFLTTWENARTTFGASTPVDGSRFDNSSRLRQVEGQLRSAAPDSSWVGTASEAYAGKNERLAGSLGRLAEIDKLLGVEVDRSASVVAAGRQQLDAVRKWVLDAAATVPNTPAGERALVPIVAKGVSDVSGIIERSHSDMEAIAARVRSLRGAYDDVSALNGRDGEGTGPDGKPGDDSSAKTGDSEIPPPPPWEKHDEGSGEWGSQPWYSRGDDAAFKAAIEAGLPVIGQKWPHAADLLGHYLDNSGTPYPLDVDAMMNDIPDMRNRADAMVDDQVNRIVADAAATGQYGVPVSFRTEPWQGYYMDSEANPDWYRAVGGVDMSVGGVVTVYPPDTPGGEPRVHVESQVNVADRYNWDEGKETKIGPITITDKQMAGLQTAGLAREFDIAGASSVSSYDGTPR